MFFKNNYAFDFTINLFYILYMWSPIDIFFIAWFCNFSPCGDARLKVSDIVKTKENIILKESVGLRNEN